MKIKFFACILAFVAIAFMTCVKETTETKEPVASGILVDESGNPVAGATVYAFDLYHAPWPGDTGLAKTDRALGWATTDASGRYTLYLALPGMINIYAESPDGKIAFIDSVVVSRNSSVEVPAATAKLPGTVAGTFFLAGETDSIKPKVSISIAGMPVIEVSDSSRNYLVTGIPEGSYDLAFMPDLGEFSGTVKHVQVVSNDTTVLDTFVLYSDYITGIPNLNAGADTLVPLGGTINLHPAASDTFGAVVSYEWKCLDKNDTTGTAAYAPADSGVFSVVTDSTLSYPHYLCICRIMDNDSNKTLDTVVIAITGISYATALAMCLDRDTVYGWKNNTQQCAAVVADSLSDTIIDSSSLYLLRGISQLTMQKFARLSVDTGKDTASRPLSYSTKSDTIVQSISIAAMDFATPDSALSIYNYATAGILADTTAKYGLTSYPASAAILSYSGSDVSIKTISDSVGDTAVNAIHVMHARLNKFYFKAIFTGLRSDTAGLHFADSVIREYEEKLVY